MGVGIEKRDSENTADTGRRYDPHAVSRALAYKLISDGEIQAVKIGTSLKIPKASVINYVTGEQKEVKFRVPAGGTDPVPAQAVQPAD